ncbi:MAG: rhodanese-like domain-containing protein [Methanomassiliicoccales archaeon]
MAPDQFISFLERVERGECLLIDVRNPEEHRAEKIQGARNVPVDSLRTDLKELDRETPLLLYCRTGKRCIRAVEQLNEMGFHHITVLDGGIEALKSYNRR